jgi:hypothetical protein
MNRVIVSDFFARSPALVFPLIALGAFLFVFIVVTVGAVLMDRERLDRLARMPLSEGEEVDHV